MARTLCEEYKEAIVAFLVERDGNLCQICRTPLGENRDIDHIVPVKKGGKHCLSNFQLAHGACNSAKGPK